MSTTITVSKVDIDLLRMQRDLLVEIIFNELQPGGHAPRRFKKEETDLMEGLVTLADEMLDIAEGYK